MSQTRTDAATPTAATGAGTTGLDDGRREDAVDPVELFDLLGDDAARAAVNALTDGPATARELVDELEASRPTVYRRLDRLEDAGLVESSTALHDDGHRRKQFSLALDRVVCAFDEDGLGVRDAAGA